MQVCRQVVKKYEEEIEQVVEGWVEQVTTVCRDWPWPLDWLCKAVTTLVKVVWTVVSTIIKVVVTTVCYTVTLAATFVGALVNIMLSIPVVGPLVSAVRGGLAWLWSQAVGSIDAGLGLIGLRPLKNLRLHLVILMRPDRTLTVPADRVGLAIARTEEILRGRAQVRLHATVHQVDTPSPRGALYVDSGAGLLGEELTEAGLYFRSLIRDKLWAHGALFAAKIGAPIVAFVVDGVGTTGETGCSSGPLADYVCIEGGQLIVPPRTTPVVAPVPAQPAGATTASASDVLAHEIAHACGLLHDSALDEASGDITNLMFFASARNGVARGSNLSPFQRAILRSSPHVTYL